MCILLDGVKHWMSSLLDGVKNSICILLDGVKHWMSILLGGVKNSMCILLDVVKHWMSILLDGVKHWMSGPKQIIELNRLNIYNFRRNISTLR